MTELNDSELIDASLLDAENTDQEGVVNELCERLMVRSHQLNTYTFKLLEAIGHPTDEEGNFAGIDELSIDDIFDKLTEKLAYLEFYEANYDGDEL